jgi:riboflavin synthase
MFTGLIEEIGHITGIMKGRNSYQFVIKAHKVLTDSKIGDSICTNGASLTITQMTQSEFTVDVMSETVMMTNFKELKNGSPVNLERAMQLSDRLGGHLVSGHIDGVGKIISIDKDDIAWRIKIEAHEALISKILDKGSIAVDGISLTVVRVTDKSFEISIIPHTALETTLLQKNINDTVNLETDMIGKYVFQFLAKSKKDESPSVTMDLLQKNGFL